MQSGSLGVGVGSLSAAPDASAISAEAIKLMSSLQSVVTAISALGAQLQANTGGVPGMADLPGRLTDFLLLDHLRTHAAGAHHLLHLLGLVEDESVPPAGQPGERVNWNRLNLVLQDPRRIFNDVFAWDTDFDFQKAMTRLNNAMRSAGMAGGMYPQSDAIAAELGADEELWELRLPFLEAGLTPATHRQFGITFSPAPAKAGQKAGFALLPYITRSNAFDFDVCDSGQLTFESSADIRGVGFLVRPPGAATGLLNLSGAYHGALRIREKPATAKEHILVGSAGGSRLSVQGLGIEWFASGSRDDLDLGMRADIDALRLVIRGNEGDGFLQKVLSGVQVDAKSAIGLGMSLRSGFSFRGGGKLAMDIGTHIDLGPVHLNGLRFALAPTEHDLVLEAGAVLKFDLGPLQAVVENMGLRASLAFTPGNLGPADLNVSFMPPNGVGLSLDAGGFKGGGFLRLDAERGEYAGALELDFKGLFAVKAIGIINTKMPDGSPGFSLLILISAEFTPIQLSFGFTLNGVGGLAGINRRLDTPALLNGVRTGAVDSILFPSDPIRDAPIIISNLSAIFPIAVGRHVFGPMAIIGWGTPTLISLELAIVLEVPAPITLALLGTASIRLPEDVEVVSLNIDVVGVLDFGRSLLAVDASLRDSYVAAFAIGGDMAMRLSFGSDPNFALAVGGLHPHFDPPPGFPVLRRVSLSLGAGDNPRIGIEGYLAVTSNSFQFGAKAELYAEAGGFSVKGWLGFDALFIREPFSFRIDFSAGVGLYRGSSKIAGVTVKGTLTGPNPFHAWGKASLSLLFFDISVPFDRTFGSRRTDPALSPLDPWAPLKAAIELAENWSAETQPGVSAGVTVRPPEEIPGLLLLHPMGVATLRQKVVPLNRTLEKFGAYAISGPDRFDVKDVLVGDDPAGSWDTVDDHFPPGDFEELSESEQVSRDSFEDMVAGVKVGAATVDAPMPEIKTAPLEYETRIIDAPWRTRPLPRFQLDRVVQLAGVRLGSAGAPGSGRTRFARDDGRAAGVTLGPELYAVATTDSLAAVPDLAAGVTKGAAHLAVKHAPAGAATGVQVVPAHELEEA